MAAAIPGARAGVLRSGWRPLARRAAWAYVAGPSLGDALAACDRAARRGLAASIGFWDGGESPRAVADAYLSALDAVAASRLDCYLSIKAPALDNARGLLLEILARARRPGIRVHFDSLGPEARSVVSLIGAALPQHAAIGCTLPARWRRSLADVEDAIALGLHVRVVKGEWPDVDRPALDPRRGMLWLVDRLAGRARHVAIATHDVALGRQALSRLRAAGTPCELELLYGLPRRRALAAARDAGVPARLYVPHGRARLPYRLSDAPAHPAALWWAARDLLRARMRHVARGLAVPAAAAEATR